MNPEPKDGAFAIGCNYWASHAGMYMWRRWDAACVKDDLKALKALGLKVPPEFLRRVRTEMDANVSDVELCEFEGKTHLLYCTGNQWSCGGVACEAVYDGPAARFLASFF